MTSHNNFYTSYACFVQLGLQEATGELIAKLSTAADDRQKHVSSDITVTADPDKIDPVAAVGFTSAPFEFDYTFKVNLLLT